MFISFWYATFVFGDDSDTRAEIFLNGKKVALVRNTRDGQDLITLINRAGEPKIRQLLLQYETRNGYGPTSVVCTYEEIEVPTA